MIPNTTSRINQLLITSETVDNPFVCGEYSTVLSKDITYPVIRIYANQNPDVLESFNKIFQFLKQDPNPGKVSAFYFPVLRGRHCGEWDIICDHIKKITYVIREEEAEQLGILSEISDFIVLCLKASNFFYRSERGITEEQAKRERDAYIKKMQQEAEAKGTNNPNIQRLIQDLEHPIGILNRMKVGASWYYDKTTTTVTLVASWCWKKPVQPSLISGASESTSPANTDILSRCLKRLETAKVSLFYDKKGQQDYCSNNNLHNFSFEFTKAGTDPVEQELARHRLAISAYKQD